MGAIRCERFALNRLHVSLEIRFLIGRCAIPSTAKRAVHAFSNSHWDTARNSSR